MKKYILTLATLTATVFMFISGLAQTPTVGLIYADEENASEGYLLFTPGNNNSVYLVNNCGEKINEWTFSEVPGATCYLLEDGTLLRAGKDTLQIRDWDNNIVWTYPTQANDLRQHHDIEPLPNGNILLVCRENIPSAQMIAKGKDTTKVQPVTRLDKIVEIQPIGTDSATIVWEWRIFDHFIQDFDPSKENYGVISEHPELIDINYESNDEVIWTHMNAVDYNAELDQVLITSRNLSEIYIIDHSTTTEEASGHTGGNYDSGGDFLWRWGNVEVYRKEEPHEQKLYLPHDAKWVEAGYADEGKISVFNNRGDGTDTFSSIHLILPELTQDGYMLEKGIFLPEDYNWSWSGMILGETVYEPIKSGAHSLPNGNLMMCETSRGRVTELTKDGDLLWAYINPSGTQIWDQYEEFPLADNEIFRGEKYLPDFAGFIGKDLSSQGIIENINDSSELCIQIVDIDDVFASNGNISVVNPVVNNQLEFGNFVEFQTILVTDLSGKILIRKNNFKGSSLPVYLKPSVYILKVVHEDKITTRKIIVR